MQAPSVILSSTRRPRWRCEHPRSTICNMIAVVSARVGGRVKVTIEILHVTAVSVFHLHTTLHGLFLMIPQDTAYSTISALFLLLEIEAYRGLFFNKLLVIFGFQLLLTFNDHKSIFQSLYHFISI